MTKNFKLSIYTFKTSVFDDVVRVHMYIHMHVPIAELDIDEMLQSNINPNNLYRHEWQHTIYLQYVYRVVLPIYLYRWILLLICIR